MCMMHLMLMLGYLIVENISFFDKVWGRKCNGDIIVKIWMSLKRGGLLNEDFLNDKLKGFSEILETEFLRSLE